MADRRTIDPTEHRPPVRSAAILVCTRDRPHELAQCLASIAALDKPDGITLSVCIGDNNEVSQRAEILDLAEPLGLDLHYGHEPERGYASVRNCTIELALETNADILILIDDDSTATPTFLVEYIAAFKRYDADAIVGRIDGISISAKEGQRMRKAGTGNVAIRRWIVDDQTGAGLRFDPRLNLLGFEDFEFFREVVRLGGAIYRSDRPVTLTLLPPHTMGHQQDETYDDLSKLKAFARMEGRNEIVATRLRHGLPRALYRATTRFATMLGQGTIAYLVGILSTPISKKKAQSRRQKAQLRILRARGAFGGLFKPGYDRARSKSGELVEVPGTGL